MAGSNSLSTASMSPDDNSDLKDGLLLSDDPHFALHGEIMMLILVLLFLSFLFFLLVFLCLKNKRSLGHVPPKHGSLEQVTPWNNFPVIQFRDHLQSASTLQPQHDQDHCRTTHQSA